MVALGLLSVQAEGRSERVNAGRHEAGLGLAALAPKRTCCLLQALWDEVLSANRAGKRKAMM